MNNPALVIPLVLVVTTLGAIGQTLLKLALTRVPVGGASRVVVALLAEPAFWGGGVTVALGGVTWLYVLSRAQITFAMPFLGMGFVLTMVTSALILHEPQPLLRIVGTLVIAAGMAMVALAR